MNEPNSVIAGKLQLILLAGKTGGDPRSGRPPENILNLADIKHVASSSAAVFPLGGSPYSLINYPVPAGQCLVIDYVSLYTTLDDNSTLQVNYGLNGNYSARWRVTPGGGATENYTAFVGSQALLNSPCFMVFPGSTTAILQLTTGVVTDPDILMLYRMNGYLLDSSLYTVMKKHQTIFGNY